MLLEYFVIINIKKNQASFQAFIELTQFKICMKKYLRYKKLHKSFRKAPLGITTNLR